MKEEEEEKEQKPGKKKKEPLIDPKTNKPIRMFSDLVNSITETNIVHYAFKKLNFEVNEFF